MSTSCTCLHSNVARGVGSEVDLTAGANHSCCHRPLSTAVEVIFTSCLVLGCLSPLNDHHGHLVLKVRATRRLPSCDYTGQDSFLSGPSFSTSFLEPFIITRQTPWTFNPNRLKRASGRLSYPFRQDSENKDFDHQHGQSHFKLKRIVSSFSVGTGRLMTPSSFYLGAG
jgi:hypothetical protein